METSERIEELWEAIDRVGERIEHEAVRRAEECDKLRAQLREQAAAMGELELRVIDLEHQLKSLRYDRMR